MMFPSKMRGEGETTSSVPVVIMLSDASFAASKDIFQLVNAVWRGSRIMSIKVLTAAAPVQSSAVRVARFVLRKILFRFLQHQLSVSATGNLHAAPVGDLLRGLWPPSAAQRCSACASRLVSSFC